MHVPTFVADMAQRTDRPGTVQRYRVATSWQLVSRDPESGIIGSESPPLDGLVPVRGVTKMPAHTVRCQRAVHRHVHQPMHRRMGLVFATPAAPRYLVVPTAHWNVEAKDVGDG